MIKGEIPLYIEFMGPSGVGKSTLLKEVCKIYDNNLNWLTPTEFIQLENPIIRNEIFSSTYQEIIKYKINKILIIRIKL